ncbi:MAG: right-handed parallel beta-helix repeat-containing protein, partial [Verrucomicrobiales bacterium]
SPDGEVVGDLVFRGLALRGNCRRTGNSVVGGDPVTGDGWDMSHKAISSFGVVEGLLVENCLLEGWRGEIIYGGSRGVRGLRIVDSTIANCNASAVSTGDVVIESSEIYNCLNGVENFGHDGAMTTIRDSEIRDCTSGVVYIGQLRASLVVEDSLIRNCKWAFFFANFAHHVRLERNTVRDCEVFVFAIDHGAYPAERVGHEGFSSFRITDNVIDGRTRSSHRVIYWQGHAGAPMRDWLVADNRVGPGNWKTFVLEYYGSERAEPRSLGLERNLLPRGVRPYFLGKSSKGVPPRPRIIQR